MKKIYFAIILLFISAKTFAQTNSVELKDQGGASIGLYGSIAAAYAAITSPLTQAYIIELTSTYNGSLEIVPITISSIAGASASNTVTIRPAAGLTSATISGDTSAASVLSLDNASHIIIDGRAGGTGPAALTFHNTSTGYNGNSIGLINGSTDNIIRYCNIENDATISAGRGIAFMGSNSNKGNSNNLVEYCNFISGRYKVYFAGSATAYNTGNKIFACDFSNIVFVGIWSYTNTSNLTIDSCTIHSASPSMDSPYGILFDRQADSATITRNRIYDMNNGTGAGDVNGIAVRSTDDSLPGHVFIANNFISMSSPNTNVNEVYGILYEGDNPTSAVITHNSIYLCPALASSASISACIKKTGNDTSHYVIKNNILVNERAGGLSSEHVAISLPGPFGIDELNENTYNAHIGTFATWNSQVFTNLITYKATTGPLLENLSNTEPVSFASATDLHLAASSMGNENLGCTLFPVVTTDIDDEARGTVPYRGADESTPLLTSINFISNENGIALYPNPAHDKINIKLNQHIQDNSILNIYSTDGKIILSEKINSNNITINLSEHKIARGMYFVSIASGMMVRFVVE